MSTYLPGEPIGADYYAQFAESDDLRDNVMFRAPKFRHHVAEDETAIDMVERAAAGLIERHGHDTIANVDILITHTQMPDMPFYGGGGGMAHRLGMKPNWVLDLHNGGCAAFVLGLKVARNLIESGEGRTALIAVAQNAAGQAFDQPTIRRKAQASVPGDGAAVGLVTLSDESPILDIECRTYGEFAGDMTLAVDPPRKWWQAGPGEGCIGFTESKITKVLARGNRQVPEVSYAVCDRIGVKPKDLDLLVTNQPNRVFLRNWREALELPKERHRRHLRRLRQPVRRRHPDEPRSCDLGGAAEEGRRRDDGGVRTRGGLRRRRRRALGWSRLMATLRRDVTDAAVGALPTARDPLALSLNENPFPPLPAVRSALISAIDAGNRYPEFLPERLRALIAGHVGVRDEQVVIGVGATGVIMQVLSAVTSPGDRMVMTSPTFDGYPIFAQMARLESVTVPLDAHGHHDLDAMADAAATARVVVVCRPHNPTGTVEPSADIERFLRRVPPETVVLLDEAYVEFLSPHHRIDAPALVGRYPNVVVLRTFSKAYGLAGLRIGYGFCAPELARTLWTMQLPFGIGITGLVAVATSYDAESELQQRIRMITAERRYLRMRLRAMGVYSTDTHANFVYMPPWRQPWPEVFDGTGLQVRSYADGGVRISVGNRQSTRAVLSAVSTALGTRRSG